MRRFIAPTVVAVVAVLILGGTAWAQTVKIVVDSGDYISIKPSMARVASNAQGVSGGNYIQVPPRRPRPENESGPTDDGNARYKVRVPTAGTYTLWARTWWYDSCGNSFFVVIDDRPSTYIEDATYKTWHWVKGPQVQLSAGEHIIRFQNREDGARLDQFMLINNSRYVPTRVETRTPSFIVK